MDNREIEKLMDKYKKEMLEYSKKNSSAGYNGKASGQDNAPDEREAVLVNAIQSGSAVQRDRRDPIITKSDEQKAVEKTPEPPKSTIPVANSEYPDLISGTESDSDVRRNLIRECEGISSNPNATAEQKTRCAEITAFLSDHKENGMLRIEAFASDRVFGISSARVLIFLPLPSGNITLFDGLTNINGETASVRLPTPAKALSLTPSDNKLLPYSVYSVYVEHAGFVPAVFSNVPVFSEIESIQPVQLLSEVTESSEPNPIVVDESQLNYL